MSFADLPPERRREAQKKAAQTRKRNRLARIDERQELAAEPIDQEEIDRLSAALPPERVTHARTDPIIPSSGAERPQTLADLGLKVEEEFRIDEILTNEEIKAAEARGRALFESEQRKRRLKLVEDAAYDEARRISGAVPADEQRQRELEQETEITIILPSLRTPPPNSREIFPDPIIIDQRIFMHGRTYVVTAVEAEYLRDRMGRAREHILQVEGRSKTSRNPYLGDISFNGFAPASGGGGFGMSFDAIHRRPT